MVRIKCLEMKLRNTEYYPPFTFSANCHINFYAHMLLLFGLYFTLGRKNFLRYILVADKYIQTCSEVQKNTFLGCVCSIKCIAVHCK